jgi:hypothetical protein
MTLWIDANNQLHDDMGGAALTLPSWPKGLTQATQAQIDAIQNPVPTLAQAQTDSANIIDAQAGATRAKYITTVAGQSETYLSKAADAANYKAAGYPFASIASYPWVQAEAVAINGASPTAAQTQAAADGILAAEAAWIALGAKIEQARRAGGVAVAAATTVAAVQAAQDTAVAALAAL